MVCIVRVLAVAFNDKSPPGFNAELPAPTDDDIEVCIHANEPRDSYEDVFIKIILIFNNYMAFLTYDNARVAWGGRVARI